MYRSNYKNKIKNCNCFLKILRKDRKIIIILSKIIPNAFGNKMQEKETRLQYLTKSLIDVKGYDISK